MAPDAPLPAWEGGQPAWSLWTGDEKSNTAPDPRLIGMANHAVLTGSSIEDTIDGRHIVACPEVIVLWLELNDERPPADFKLVDEANMRDVWFWDLTDEPVPE